MTNNYILRRLRYTFDFSDSKMIALWGMAECTVTREQVSAWLKKDDDPAYVNCSDRHLAIFLNGLINELRGKKDGAQAVPESRINNNIILRKLKIALNLINEDMLAIMDLAGMPLGKSELSAFFRKPGHHHYRELQDQMLRKFMQGIQIKYRDKTVQRESESKPTPPSSPVAKETSNEGKTNQEEQTNSHIWKAPD